VHIKSYPIISLLDGICPETFIFLQARVGFFPHCHHMDELIKNVILADLRLLMRMEPPLTEGF
jgi:hypothetical protein